METTEPTDDAFLGGKLRILQPRVGYRAGLDAVLLAAAIPANPGLQQRVLDIGAGVGVVGLAVAARVADTRVVLIERDETLASFARENASRNGLADRVGVITADVTQGGAMLNAPDRPAELTPGSFDHVAANPPYYREGSGTAPTSARRKAAHQLPPDTLDRWIALLATAAASGGSLSLVHRADALDAILAALAGRFGNIRILPVHPRNGVPAGRILVGARKASRAPLTILPPLILHDDSGAFHPAVENILRRGAPLDLHG